MILSDAKWWLSLFPRSKLLKFREGGVGRIRGRTAAGGRVRAAADGELFIVEEIHGLLFHRWRPDSDVFKLAGVIERAEADPAFGKCFVHRSHDRFDQVIEVNLA